MDKYKVGKTKRPRRRHFRQFIRPDTPTTLISNVRKSDASGCPVTHNWYRSPVTRLKAQPSRRRDVNRRKGAAVGKRGAAQSKGVHGASTYSCPIVSGSSPLTLQFGRPPVLPEGGRPTTRTASSTPGSAYSWLSCARYRSCPPDDRSHCLQPFAVRVPPPP